MKPLLLGVPFDNGIRMMQRCGRGVTGAAAGPAAVFAALADWPGERRMLDLDEVRFQVTPANRDDPDAVQAHNELTLAGHARIEREAEALVRSSRRIVAVGGDHSITCPLLRGLVRGLGLRRPALIYVDAHLDLRTLETHAGIAGLISSGNPFRRLLEDPAVGLAGGRVAAVGIHAADSPVFAEMLAYARWRGMRLVLDEECRRREPAALARELLAAVAADADGLYLSLDIDAVAAGAAPGVSAPAGAGLDPDWWLALVAELGQRGDWAGADLVEVSSRERHWQELFGAAAPLAGEGLEQTAALAAATLRLLLTEGEGVTAASG